MRNFQLNHTLLLGCLLVVIFFGCEKWDLERASFTQVITVGALEVGFSSAFLLGDIEDLRNAQIIETGFVYSMTAADDQSLRLSQEAVTVAKSPQLDNKRTSGDWAFAARAKDLSSSTKYFFRAYIVLESSESVYGDIDSLTTSELVVSSATISRNTTDCAGSVNVSVNIAGGRAVENGAFGILWSSDELDGDPLLENANLIPGQVLDASGSLMLELEVMCGTTYFVRGYFSTGETVVYGPVSAFSTSSGGSWIPAGMFPFKPSAETCFHSFSNNEFGFAINADPSAIESVLWKYDGVDWQSASPPPFLFNCSNKPPGASIEKIFDIGNLDFWEYNIGNDQWEDWSRQASTGSIILSSTFEFLHNRTLYWGTGFDEANDTLSSDCFWVPAVSSNTRPFTAFPGKPRINTSHFVFEGDGYVGLGRDLEGQYFTDYWKLDFDTRMWTPVAGLAEGIEPSLEFAFNGKAYILTGHNAEEEPVSNFYEYDPDLDNWERLADFGSGDGTAAIGFGINGIIYGGLGVSENGEVKQEIWRYVPELK